MRHGLIAKHSARWLQENGAWYSLLCYSLPTAKRLGWEAVVSMCCARPNVPSIAQPDTRFYRDGVSVLCSSIRARAVVKTSHHSSHISSMQSSPDPSDPNSIDAIRSSSPWLVLSQSRPEVSPKRLRRSYAQYPSTGHSHARKYGEWPRRQHTTRHVYKRKASWLAYWRRGRRCSLAG